VEKKKCNCELKTTGVIDSRLTIGNFIRRRRQCDKCSTRFSTIEIDRDYLLTIIKDESIDDFKKKIEVTSKRVLSAEQLKSRKLYELKRKIDNNTKRKKLLEEELNSY
jgi:transcriptional repressor NrdR